MAAVSALAGALLQLSSVETAAGRENVKNCVKGKRGKKAAHSAAADEKEVQAKEEAKAIIERLEIQKGKLRGKRKLAKVASAAAKSVRSGKRGSEPRESSEGAEKSHGTEQSVAEGGGDIARLEWILASGIKREAIAAVPQKATAEARTAGGATSEAESKGGESGDSSIPAARLKRRKENGGGDEGGEGAAAEGEKKQAKKRKLRSTTEVEAEKEEDGAVADEAEWDDGKEAEAAAKDAERKKRTLFVGNIPLGTKRGELARLLGIEKSACESIYFRAINVGPKYNNDRRAGVLSGKFEGACKTHNAYVVLKDETLVSTIAEKNKVMLGENRLRVMPLDGGRKFAKYDRKKTVFVGNVPVTATEDDLLQVFENAGHEVAACRLIRDAATGIGKGFGFVYFEEKSSVKPALALSGSLSLQERNLRVTPAMKAEDAAKERNEKIAKREAKEAEKRRKREVPKKLMKKKHKKRT